MDQAYKKSQLVKGIQRVANEERDTDQYITSRRNSQAQSQKYLNFHNNTTTRKRNQEDERGGGVVKSKKLFKQEIRKSYQSIDEESEHQVVIYTRFLHVQLGQKIIHIKSEDPIGSIISSNIRADIQRQGQRPKQKRSSKNNHQNSSGEITRKYQNSKSNKQVGGTFKQAKLSNQEDYSSKNDGKNNLNSNYPETKLFSPLVKASQQIVMIKSEFKEKPIRSKEHLRFDYPLSRDDTPNQRINNSHNNIKRLQINQVISPSSVIEKYQPPQSAREGLMSKHQQRPSKEFPIKDTAEEFSQTRKTNRNCDLEETQNLTSSKKIFSMIVNEKLLNSTNQNAKKEEISRISSMPFGKQISSRFGSLFKLQKKNLLDEEVLALDENNLNNSGNSLKKKYQKSKESSFDIQSEHESDHELFSQKQQDSKEYLRAKSRQKASRGSSPKREASLHRPQKQEDFRKSGFKIKPQIQYDVQRQRMKSQRSKSPIDDTLYQKRKHIMSYDENSLERELIEKLNEESEITVDPQQQKHRGKSQLKQRGQSNLRQSQRKSRTQHRKKNQSRMKQKSYDSEDPSNSSRDSSSDDDFSESSDYNNRRSTFQPEDLRRRSQQKRNKSSRQKKRQSLKKQQKGGSKTNQMPLQMPQVNMMIPPQFNMFGFQMPMMPSSTQLMNFPNMMQYPGSQIPYMMQQQQQQQQQQQYYNMLYGQIQQQMQQNFFQQQPQTQTTQPDEQKSATPKKNINTEEKSKKNMKSQDRSTTSNARGKDNAQNTIINTFNQSNILRQEHPPLICSNTIINTWIEQKNSNNNESNQFPFNVNIQNSTTNQSFQPNSNFNQINNLDAQNKSQYLGQSISQNGTARATQDFIPNKSVNQNDSAFLKLNKMQNTFSNQTLESIDQDFKFGQIQNLQNQSKQISEEPGSSNKIQHHRLGSPQSNVSRLDVQSTNNTGDYVSSLAPSQQAILGLQNRRSINIQSQIKEVNQMYLNKLKDKYQKVNLNDESLTVSVNNHQDKNERSSEFILSPRMTSRNQIGLTHNNSTPIKDLITEQKIQTSVQTSQADRESILLMTKQSSVFKEKRLSSIQPSELTKHQYPQYYDTNQDTLQSDAFQQNFQIERHRSPQPKEFKMFQYENPKQDDIQLKLRVLNQKLSQSRQTSIRSKPIKEAAVDLESNYDENYSHIEQKLQQLKDKKFRREDNYERSIDSRHSQSQSIQDRKTIDQNRQSRQPNQASQINPIKQQSINSSIVQTKQIKINVDHHNNKIEDQIFNYNDDQLSTKPGLIIIETSPQSNRSQNKIFNKFQNQIKSPRIFKDQQQFNNIKTEGNGSESMRSSMVTMENERQSQHAYYEKNTNKKKYLNSSVQQNMRKGTNKNPTSTNNNNPYNNANKILDFNQKNMTFCQEEIKNSNISSTNSNYKNRQSISSNGNIKLLQMTKSIDRRDEKEAIIEIFDKPKHKNQTMSMSVDTRDKNRKQSNSEALSLAEIFKQKMGSKATQLNNERRFNQSQQQNIQMPVIQEKESKHEKEKERSKQEILELRRKMMKSNVKEKKDNFNPDQSKDPSLKSKDMPYDLMQRLSKGMKIQLDSKEMVKLSHKNYDNLPEVKRKKEEERKKEDYKQRQQIVKKYAEELEKKRKQIHLKKQASSNSDAF
ncbi:UNKNOWN [Stylonychia lemnae]|uniref:Uncharacterized protein n=1 Tax=Stylonychia lemnae TaxID=5949 RepID=A0A078BCG3_STYLE|nr:UNKNOWN [Stylonychia lemnae]|eukprot:CDW90892.1 UNKNOWN [Stylonychia lemnae]